MKEYHVELGNEIEVLRAHLPGGFDFYEVAGQLIFPAGLRRDQPLPPFMVLVTRVRQLSNSSMKIFEDVSRPTTGNYIALTDIGDGDGAAWVEVDLDLSITRGRVFAAVGELMKLPHSFEREQIHGVEYHKTARKPRERPSPSAGADTHHAATDTQEEMDSGSSKASRRFDCFRTA